MYFEIEKRNDNLNSYRLITIVNKGGNRDTGDCGFTRSESILLQNGYSL